MYTKFVVLLVLVASAYACTDGKDNLVEVGDVSNGAYNAHFQNAEGMVYDSSNNPSCYKGEANLKLPGVLKLVSGTVVVKQSMNLINNVVAKLTLKKDSSILGKICDNGVSKNILIPNKDCTIALCNNALESPLCTLLEQAGSHDLSQIEKTMGITGTLALPSLPSSFKGIMKGKWEVGVSLVSNGVVVADIKLPSNEQFIYVDE
uniref:ML domain-containing protein n=1 Tax=Parastrongyloides trichosuri TaxID=131310 RepID=A0A0N5A431_PARTI